MPIFEQRVRICFFAALAAGLLAAEARAQPAGENGIGLTPSRFELVVPRGAERTVVVNVIYNSLSGEGRPLRLVASLGDWGMTAEGEVDFYRAGSRAGSAAPWMVYSPGEMTAAPGRVHPIRVTVSVPPDAEPGDHLAALFIESRPDNFKLEENRRQVVLRFRIAALFYITVPDAAGRGALEDLRVAANESGILVTPTLRNLGNTHIRPAHSLRILDAGGAVVFEMPEAEAAPVLAGGLLKRPLWIGRPLPAGAYEVRYRVDFKDGAAVTEGRASLIVKGGSPAREN